MKYRRAAVCLLAGLCLVLSACSAPAGAEEKASEIRVKYVGEETSSVSALVRADYGERQYEYELKYTGDENTGIIEVMSPESIAGFKINIEDGKVNTSFDDIVLYMGEISSLDITPACALPTILGSWKSGYITNSKYENLDGENTVAVTVCVDDETETRTWFESETLEPIKSEIINEGRTVVFLEFEKGG